MSDVTLSASGPPSVVLPPEPEDVRDRIAALDAVGPDMRRAAATAIVADHPRSLTAWATLGDLGRDDVERYAAYRVGYHRGLDALRANGWRGSGYVRWQHETNRGFLRALVGLGAMAAAIGEHDEADRIQLFLGQLDPSGEWRPG
jgi:hypothetical protein